MTLPNPSYSQSLLGHPVDSESAAITKIKQSLKLLQHPEGGHFVETDRDERKVPNPFKGSSIYENASAKPENSMGEIDESNERSASTTIHYFLDPKSPVGVFHRNKGRTVHTLHSGRGVYVIIHADQASHSADGKAPIEVFTVGHDIANGEKLQWIVEGGKFKGTYILPDPVQEHSEKGLLISETVVPGFEFSDHDFLTKDMLQSLVSKEDFKRLHWLLKKSEQ